MKIALIDVDSKMPNLALMKISAHHKNKGDQTSLYKPLFDRPDKAYASKIFTFTDDYKYFPSCEIVKGGSGYGLDNTLDRDIEHIYPDYDLYHIDYAMGFTTRGCIRNCDFCIVPEKEGKIQAVADIYQFWNGQKQLMLMDNNLTALPDHFERILNQLIDNKIATNFSQGLDIRLINEDMAKLLAKVKLYKRIHFAFDHVRDEKHVRKGIKILNDNGVKGYKLTFYVLIGFDSTPEEDLYRVELLRSLKVDPFVMPYDKKNDYQKKFSRWVNHKAIFKTVKWQDYR